MVAGIAGFAAGVSAEDIIAKARGNAHVAAARQVAMYLCHVSLEWSLGRVAIAFRRDRSTVAYACHAIEDKRDDAKFDRWVAGLETMVRRAPQQAKRAALR
jgi:chromosomal replication initiation ATPase DnaA